MTLPAPATALRGRIADPGLEQPLGLGVAEDQSAADVFGRIRDAELLPDIFDKPEERGFQERFDGW